MADIATFSAITLALYAGHHVGDYWVQTDHQAQHEGKEGAEGKAACLLHVLTYILTQSLFAMLVCIVFDLTPGYWQYLGGFAISGITHWMADRREFGLMFKLARLLPGKANFLKLGVPRADVELENWSDCESCRGTGSAYDESTGGKCWDCRGRGRTPTYVGDNPSLGTGAWALDQSWHIFWGVFVAGIVISL